MDMRAWLPAALGATLLLVSPVAAQTSKPATPSADEGMQTITATIEAIDKTKRLVTLKGPKGNLATVHADPSMKRFDELKVGDTVTASYYETTVVHVRQPGEPAPKPESMGLTPRKGAPGLTASMQETVTVVVQSVDRANRSVTIKKQNGDIVSMRVENPKYLDAAKPGQTVDITFTQAMLIRADPPR